MSDIRCNDCAFIPVDTTTLPEGWGELSIKIKKGDEMTVFATRHLCPNCMNMRKQVAHVNIHFQGGHP